MIDDPRSLTYEELEQQWSPLLHKFANWKFGMDEEDILQELRIVLWKAQRQYDPTWGVKFITYLYRALLHKTGQLRDRVQRTKCRVPPASLVTLLDFSEPMTSTKFKMFRQCMVYDDTTIFDCTAGFSQEAEEIARLILDGERTKKSWESHGLTLSQIRIGLKDLRASLTSPGREQDAERN